jgi:membrane protease YdiL (CAAX protease family)
MASIEERNNGFAMAVLVEGGLALVAVVMAWLFSVPLRDQLPSTSRDLVFATLRGVLMTIPMLAVFFWLVHSSRATLRELREQVEWLVGEMFPDATTGQFAMVAVLAGVGEELLFRGVVQWLASAWTHPIVGLVIGSLLFGLLHALSKLYFVLATTIGFLFGWLVYEYNDLVAPMVAHSLYDFVALVYLHRSRLHSQNAPPS